MTASIVPLGASAFLSTDPRRNTRVFRSDASIILVGGRGAGKRTLGFIAAKHLGRRLLTEEHFFEQVTGSTRAAFLQQRGRDAFQRQMAIVLAGVLETNRFNCVIECGYAALCKETEAIIRRIAETSPVIYVHRDKGDVYKLLNITPTEAERLSVTEQRYRDISNSEYFNLRDDGAEEQNAAAPTVRSTLMSSARLVHARNDLTAYLDLILGQGLTRSFIDNPFSIGAIPLEYRAHATFVLHVRLSSLLNMKIDVASLEASGEAVELIIDTWPDNMFDVIAEQVAIIRRKLRVPIVYNVEEHPREEPRRIQEEGDAVDLQLLLHGLKLGVEYLSLDLSRNTNIVSRVLAMRGRTKIIGHYTFRGFGLKPWDDDSYVECFKRGQDLGCHIVRILRFCMGEKPEKSRREFLEKVDALPEPKPLLVAYDFSVFGATIPQFVFRLTPVTHQLLQNSPREWVAGVNTCRGTLRSGFRTGKLQALRFYTAGSNVHYSASPSMHRAAYEHYMMPHMYDAKQCSNLDDVLRLRSDEDFGGACIAPPFKIDIMPHIDHISAHATAIGAVNIILPLRGETSSILDHANARNKSGFTRNFYGDNTDWISIQTCLRRAINPRNSIQRSKTTALVIGAGGMARAAIYTLIRLGCRNIFIYNRTRSRADEVAAHFNLYAQQHHLSNKNGDYNPVCYVLNSTSQHWPEGFQQPTIILSCIPAYGTDGLPAVEFRMPSQWLLSPTGGVVVELAYEPLITPLVKQIRGMREEGNTAWVIVDGLEVVGEMAIVAFDLLTGRQAPRNLMTRVCNETWEKQYAPFQPHR